MVVFKRKQIVVLALILMIIVAGYLQYSYKQGSSIADKENGKLGDAVYVDSEVDNGELQDVAQEDDGIDAAVVKADVSASKLANDFFAQAKVDKEMSRSKSNDSLKAISDDTNATKETRTEAYDRMMQLIDNSEKEANIETLIKQKGFSDAVAIFAEDGSIDIVVKTPSLTSSQTAQIADIVSRQGKVAIENIHIRNLY